MVSARALGASPLDQSDGSRRKTNIRSRSYLFKRCSPYQYKVPTCRADGVSTFIRLCTDVSGTYPQLSSDKEQLVPGSKAGLVTGVAWSIKSRTLQVKQSLPERLLLSTFESAILLDTCIGKTDCQPSYRIRAHVVAAVGRGWPAKFHLKQDSHNRSLSPQHLLRELKRAKVRGANAGFDSYKNSKDGRGKERYLFAIIGCFGEKEFETYTNVVSTIESAISSENCHS